MSPEPKKPLVTVGLELHQQLETRTKLFCGCRPSLREGEPDFQFYRRLRPTQSELGQVDPAALFEFQRGRVIQYEADDETSCLVELDEEPPHALSQEAVDICLTAALMMNSKPVDEIHVMRKVVIDGSNTTGFQRTCIIALGGAVTVGGKPYKIQTVCLEEDAARPTGGREPVVNYSIDRLGIPLIEVATAPEIHSPEEAERVALAVGRLLRATGRMKRGLGTVRQDINISTPGGAVIEVKGVQKLELVSKVVAYEAQRQESLLRIAAELARRGCSPEMLREEFVDVTETLRATSSQVLRRALEKGGVALACRLPLFAGLLRTELGPNLRLGTEMADRARFWGRIGGLFHSDELPAYGITQEETSTIRAKVGAGSSDAFVLAAGPRENVVDGLKAVVERAVEALRGVPEETRGPNPDGTSRYMRPRPGAARMYPETDIPPIKVTEERLARLKAVLPEPLDKTVATLMEQWGLNRKLAEQVADSDFLQLFNKLASETKVAPSVIAVALTENLTSLRREGVDIDELSEEQLGETIRLVDRGLLAKEAIPEVFAWLSKHARGSATEAVEALGLRVLSEAELRKVIDETLREERSAWESRGRQALPQLMGLVMRRVRGRAEATLVRRILEEKLMQSAR
ncbi:MAG: Glu-tRNA(Gln) amidotransferase subunit GatE [Candidatus Bathyarchaeia archaeon]